MVKGYVSTNEAAEKLGITAARVRQMIRAGAIKGVQKVGQNNLIPEKELKRLESADRKAGRPPSKEKKS